MLCNDGNELHDLHNFKTHYNVSIDIARTKIMPGWDYLESVNFKGEMGISGESLTHIIAEILEKCIARTMNIFI